MAGNASRRRPSMDWPLSREEKKVCAMQLYEKDVQACEDLLESKDRALVAAKEEIKVLRRASTASSRTSVGCSSPGDSPDASTASTRTSLGCLVVACDIDVSASDSAAQTEAALRLPSPPRGREAAQAHGASPLRNPTMQRSSSLEAVTSFLPGWRTSEQEGFAANAQAQGRDNVSPRRGHGSMRRSSSLETASSFWGGAWKAVRTGAKAATHTAKETARILADETRLLVDEAKMVFEAPVSTEANSGTTTDAANSSTTVARAPETEFIEWHIDCADHSVGPGLRLEPAIQGEPRRVSAVMQGLAISNWNNESMPVTVYLYPGRREAVMRRIAVCATDELFAVDGEPMLAALEDETVGKCNQLTFRRRRKQRAAQLDGQ